MNRKYLIILLIVIFLAGGGYFILHGTSKQTTLTPQFNNADTSLNQKDDISPKNNPVSSVTASNPMKAQNSSFEAQQKDSTFSNWKTYSNDKYGFSFQHPSTLSQQGKEYEAMDNYGKVAVVSVNFIDTSSHTTLLIEYHLGPNGVKLYQYSLSQYKSSKGWYGKDGEKIEVAGNTALEAFSTISADPKGYALNPKVRLILVEFLDKQQKGEFKLQLNTPSSNNEMEAVKFKQLLSTFKITN